jgi:hypothetical protein
MITRHIGAVACYAAAFWRSRVFPDDRSISGEHYGT